MRVIKEDSLAVEAKHLQRMSQWREGTIIVYPEYFDRGYWDNVELRAKDEVLNHNLDYKRGWKQAKADTREMKWLVQN
jgi:hypothetical protein